MKQKNPLSLLIFYRRNLIKLSSFLIIILFSTFGIIVSSTLFDSWIKTPNFYKNFYKTSAVITYPAKSPNPVTLFPKDSKILQTYDIYHDFDYFMILGIEMSYPVLGIKREDIDELMRYYNLTLKQGRIFNDKKKEIILSEQIVKNEGYRLGENLNRYSAFYDYKLVGILSGKTAIGLYSFKVGEKERRKFFIDKLVTFKDKEDYVGHTKFLEIIEKEYQERFNLSISYLAWNKEWEKPMQEIEKEVNFVFNISIIIITIIFSLITFFLNIVYFQDRISEYGLLLSLGLNKFQIIKRSFWENFFVVVISWIFGLLLSKIFLEILGIKMFTPKGWYLETFPIEALPLTIPVLLGMFVAGISVVIYKIKKLDPVEIIERR